MNNRFRFSLYAIVALLLLGLSGCKDKNRLVEPHDGPAHILLKETEHNFGQLDGSASVLSHEFQLMSLWLSMMSRISAIARMWNIPRSLSVLVMA